MISTHTNSIMSPTGATNAKQVPPLASYHGFIDSTEDALLIFEACRLGRLNRTSRRLMASERRSLISGNVFVFEEHESGIRRWTDGRLWSPSRILNNFLVYREVDRKEAAPRNLVEYNFPSGGVRGALTKDEDDVPSGPLTSQKGTYYFKANGLIKKTISVNVDQVQYHMVCYYEKSEAISGQLMRPSLDPALADITIPQSLLDQQSFRKPQRAAVGDLRRERSGRGTRPYDLAMFSSSSSNSVPVNRGNPPPSQPLGIGDRQLVSAMSFDSTTSVGYSMHSQSDPETSQSPSSTVTQDSGSFSEPGTGSCSQRSYHCYGNDALGVQSPSESQTVMILAQLQQMGADPQRPSLPSISDSLTMPSSSHFYQHPFPLPPNCRHHPRPFDQPFQRTQSVTDHSIHPIQAGFAPVSFSTAASSVQSINKPFDSSIYFGPTAQSTGRSVLSLLSPM
eukprot:Partr_v1_DN26073_c1_g1_i2_m283 putative Regulatory protein